MGREKHCKQIPLACVGTLTVSRPHWVCSCSQRVCAFPVYSAQALGCSAGELSKAGPGLHALPRSKLLRFRFLDTPQRPEFCALPGSEQLRPPDSWWAHSPQVGQGVLSPPQSQPLGFLGAQRESRLRCAVFLFWRADLWLRPFRWMPTIQDPRKTWLATGSQLAVW